MIQTISAIFETTHPLQCLKILPKEYEKDREELASPRPRLLSNKKKKKRIARLSVQLTTSSKDRGAKISSTDTKSYAVTFQIWRTTKGRPKSQS